MKKRIYSAALLALMVACATQVPKQTDTSSTGSPQSPTTVTETPSPAPQTATPVPTAPASATPAKVLTVPELKLPKYSSTAMKEAAKFFAQWGNADEFYVYYFKGNVKLPLKASNTLDVEVAIKKYRECLDGLQPVEIYFKRYMWPYSNSVVGGWSGGNYIRQNPNYDLDKYERAGHWYHEITHMCGITHEINGQLENNPEAFPDLKLSFPYQVGYIFRDFVKMKDAPALAEGL